VRIGWQAGAPVIGLFLAGKVWYAIKIIYDDYGGAHSTQVAAAIHLGVLKPERTPTNEELLALPLFDRITKEHHGCLIFVGVDSEGHSIYVLGRGPSAVTVERALAGGIALVGGDPGSIRFFNTLPTVNWWMRIGGFLSRALGWIPIGRPLVLYGTRKAFPQLVRFVTEVKEAVRQHAEQPGITASDGSDIGVVAERAVKRGLLPELPSGVLMINAKTEKEES
jgi:hypothetical protein